MGRAGAERVVSIQAEYYISKGWDVDILLLLENIVAFELNPKVRIIPICENPSIPRIMNLPYWLSSIRKYGRLNNPSVIVSFAARINVIALAALFSRRDKIIVGEINDPKNDTRGWFGNVATKIFYPFASTVILQTDRTRHYFSKGIQKKSFVLPNPVTVGAYAGEVHKEKIVNLGRLLPQKNQEMLINAFHMVHMKHPDYELHIFGDGELRDRLQQQIRSLGLERAAFLRGNLMNIHSEIADAGMFVLSSDYEGLSNALLEALMMGLPCISTDCAGSDEAITDGVNGLLDPVGDTDRLSAAMERLICDEDLARTLALNAKKDAVRYSKEYVLEAWDKVISSIYER
jgi:glycosyltransferase involved in cell wall biosynthesis